MNVINLRNQVRFKTSLSTASYSNAEILTHLNEGYYTLASIIAQLNEDFYEEQKAKFNLVARSSLYSNPTDLMKFKQLRVAYSTPDSEDDYVIANSYDPSRTSNVSVDEETISTSNPLVDVTNNYFRLKPTPTSSVTNGGEIYYIARPSALVNTGDAPVLPTEYHDLLAVYASKEGTFKNSQFVKYQELKSEWFEGIERIKTDLAERNINETDSRMRNPLEDSFNRQVRELYD